MGVSSHVEPSTRCLKGLVMTFFLFHIKSPADPRTGVTGRTRRAVLVAGVVLGLAGAGCGQASAESDHVSLETARSELEAGRAVLIDVREPQEHAGGVAPGAKLLPMRQLEQRLAEIPKDTDKPVLLICHSQNRSSATTRMLRERGYSQVRFVEGGMGEWTRRGWPLVKPGP